MMQQPQALMNEAGDIGRPAIMGPDAATGIRAYMNRNRASSQRDGMFVGGAGYPSPWTESANSNAVSSRLDLQRWYDALMASKPRPPPDLTLLPGGKKD